MDLAAKKSKNTTKMGSRTIRDNQMPLKEISKRKYVDTLHSSSIRTDDDYDMPIIGKKNHNFNK